jgi:hypothetical protein
MPPPYPAQNVPWRSALPLHWLKAWILTSIHSRYVYRCTFPASVIYCGSDMYILRHTYTRTYIHTDTHTHTHTHTKPVTCYINSMKYIWIS